MRMPWAWSTRGASRSIAGAIFRHRWCRRFGPHYVFPGTFPTAVGAHRVLRGLIPGKPKNTAAEFVTGDHMPEHWRGGLLANDFRANRTVDVMSSRKTVAATPRARWRPCCLQPSIVPPGGYQDRA